MNIGRNEKCPCGNNKKYKRCYGAESADCVLYKRDSLNKHISEHNNKEKVVTKSILEFTNELSNLFYKTENGIYPVSSRMQLIGCFSIIDVLATYWFEYLGRLDGTHRLRFSEYVKSFCFTHNNKDYENSKNLCNLTIDDFYSLRCGLVHFYGLSLRNIIIMPDINDTFTEVELEEYNKKLREVSANLVFIQPMKIKNMIYDSAELMFPRTPLNPNTRSL